LKEVYKVVSNKFELDLQKDKTLKITSDTHEELVRLSMSKTETFDDVIRRLIEFYKNMNGNEAGQTTSTRSDRSS
jgi:predicted CopG family antitoxin